MSSQILRFAFDSPGPEKTARDPRWWGGEPVWVTAMRQGQLSASMFWPGSEVRGRQPSYWRSFDDAVPDGERVSQVLEWLALPSDRRPSFVTVYFSAVDDAGHDHGPNPSRCWTLQPSWIVLWVSSSRA